MRRKLLKVERTRPRLTTEDPFDHPPQLCKACGAPATHFIAVLHPMRPNSIGYRYVGCETHCKATFDAEKALTDQVYPVKGRCVVDVRPLLETGRKTGSAP